MTKDDVTIFFMFCSSPTAKVTCASDPQNTTYGPSLIFLLAVAIRGQIDPRELVLVVIQVNQL